VPQGSLDHAVQMLQEVPFFSKLRPQDLLPLAAACRLQNFRRHSIIFHRDDPGDSLHIIHTGQVRIVLTSPEGDEIVLALLEPGEFFGELSLVDGLPRSATAAANEPTVTLALTRPAFLRALEQNAHLAQQVILSLAARLRRTDLLLGDAAFLDVASRLAKRLQDLATTRHDKSAVGGPPVIRITQVELAAMVGATRETVNKELRALEGRGIIRLERGRIVLERPEALEVRAW
jgi:CRP-like cAMP-binding protein